LKKETIPVSLFLSTAMSSEWKPGFPPHESPSTQDDELGRIVRVFVLGLLIAGVAGVISAAALGPPRFNEPTVRAPGGAVSARAITAGLIAIAIGLPTGGLLSALLLGELGRGLAIGGFASFFGASIGAIIGEPIAGAIFGGLAGGIWCALRLSE